MECYYDPIIFVIVNNDPLKSNYWKLTVHIVLISDKSISKDIEGGEIVREKTIDICYAN